MAFDMGPVAVSMWAMAARWAVAVGYRLGHRPSGRDIRPNGAPAKTRATSRAVKSGI